MTVYALRVPGSSSAGLLLSRFLVFGANAGPPDTRISGLPGVYTRTYFKSVPAGETGLPPPPPPIGRAVERAVRALEAYGEHVTVTDELSLLFP